MLIPAAVLPHGDFQAYWDSEHLCARDDANLDDCYPTIHTPVFITFWKDLALFEVDITHD